MTERDAVFLPLRELAERVRARQVSPAALTRLFLDRLERLGPRYHAVVTLTAELAESQARQAEREIAAGRYRGPLHGIPYGLKDLFATACYPTTWGAGPLREQAFDYDATIVRKLQAGGAVLAAKLALVELAGGARYGRADASFTGPGLNPWDRGVWSGGSSTGSGAAVAAGLVPFGDRHRDLGFDPGAGVLLRRVRAASDLRPGEPPRRYAPHLRDGQARTDMPDRRRLRPRARGNRRP